MTPDNPTPDPIYVAAGESFVGLTKFQHGQLMPLEVPDAQHVVLGSTQKDTEAVTDLACFSRGFQAVTALDHEVRAMEGDDATVPAAKAFNFCLGLIRRSLSEDLADEVLRLCPELPEDGTASTGKVRMAFTQLSSWSDGIGRTVNASLTAQQVALNQ